jgi:hypothetical protein
MSLQIVHGDNFSFVYIIGDFTMQEAKTWKLKMNICKTFLIISSKETMYKTFLGKSCY